MIRSKNAVCWIPAYWAFCAGGSPMGISESTLYPILRRLETDGCLTVRSVEHNGRLRKLYTITERGLRRLDSFLSSEEEVIGIYDFVRRQRNDKA